MSRTTRRGRRVRIVRELGGPALLVAGEITLVQDSGDPAKNLAAVLEAALRLSRPGDSSP